MTLINTPKREQESLEAIDAHELHGLIEQAVINQSTGGLRDLPLPSCGPYVAERLRRFDRALVEYSKSKSDKKRSETRVRASRAGTELYYAVREMQERIATEQTEAQLFQIDDHTLVPHSFGPHLEVRINYRWRQSADHDWAFGDITFHHDVDLRPNYALPAPKRKPSAAKQNDELQEKLYREWDRLKSIALWSIQEFFRSGGDGAAIPKTFSAKVDAYTRGLNNFSADFWRDRS